MIGECVPNTNSIMTENCCCFLTATLRWRPWTESWEPSPSRGSDLALASPPPVRLLSCSPCTILMDWTYSRGVTFCGRQIFYSKMCWCNCRFWIAFDSAFEDLFFKSHLKVGYRYQPLKEPFGDRLSISRLTEPHTILKSPASSSLNKAEPWDKWILSNFSTCGTIASLKPLSSKSSSNSIHRTTILSLELYRFLEINTSTIIITNKKYLH